jgi:hypothetical protein
MINITNYLTIISMVAHLFLIYLYYNIKITKSQEIYLRLLSVPQVYPFVNPSESLFYYFFIIIIK